jgi:hypothetical protein
MQIHRAGRLSRRDSGAAGGEPGSTEGRGRRRRQFDRDGPPRVAFLALMPRLAILKGHVVLQLLVAVAVLTFVGHVCALPHSDSIPVASHTHHHESGEGQSHAHGSCDATVSQGQAATPTAAWLVSAVVSVATVPCFVPVRLASTLAPPSTSGITAHAPPLFLLHSALLI